MASAQQLLSMEPPLPPFVIPSEAEGSAVQRTRLGNVFLTVRRDLRFQFRGKTSTPQGPVPAFTFLVTVLVARFTTEISFEGPLAE
jgi:hypothetical protein